jgi:hypothetical protein
MLSRKHFVNPIDSHEDVAPGRLRPSQVAYSVYPIDSASINRILLTHATYVTRPLPSDPAGPSAGFLLVC